MALRITSMSVTISLSASVTVACLFSPKLYIILIHPERNVRQCMMPNHRAHPPKGALGNTPVTPQIRPITTEVTLMTKTIDGCLKPDTGQVTSNSLSTSVQTTSRFTQTEDVHETVNRPLQL